MARDRLGPSSRQSLKQQRNRRALEWASEEMKGDRDIVRAAVRRRGEELRWASEEMKGDREIVMAAIQQSLEARTVPRRLHALKCFFFIHTSTAGRFPGGNVLWRPLVTLTS